MNWKLKCLAFHILGLTGRALHRRAQRYLGTYFREISDELIASYQFHLDNYHGGVALEIGAGTDLLVPLLLSARGAPVVFGYDLSRLATIEQVNHVIRQLRSRMGGSWPELTDLDADLSRRYRIYYRAPADARCTGLADGSVDFIYSTSVLEHVPLDEISELLAECARVASPQCVMSHNIGYIDHYAHSDRSISHFNFYRFPDWIWWVFNPGMQYQNRLRHSEYEALFAHCGLCIAKSERLMATPAERTPAVPLSRRFLRYGENDLFAHDGLFVLHRSPPGQIRSAV